MDRQSILIGLRQNLETGQRDRNEAAKGFQEVLNHVPSKVSLEGADPSQPSFAEIHRSASGLNGCSERIAGFLGVRKSSRTPKPSRRYVGEKSRRSSL